MLNLSAETEQVPTLTLGAQLLIQTLPKARALFKLNLYICTTCTLCATGVVALCEVERFSSAPRRRTPRTKHGDEARVIYSRPTVNRRRASRLQSDRSSHVWMRQELIATCRGLMIQRWAKRCMPPSYLIVQPPRTKNIAFQTIHDNHYKSSPDHSSGELLGDWSNANV